MGNSFCCVRAISYTSMVVKALSFIDKPKPGSLSNALKISHSLNSGYPKIDIFMLILCNQG